MGVPEVQRRTLEKMREVILSAVPGAEEVISYQIPTYKMNGPVAAIAAFKNHCSLFVMSHDVMKQFKKELESFYTKGVTIHFPIDKPMPATLVKKLVLAKAKENKARLKTKNTTTILPKKKTIKKS